MPAEHSLWKHLQSGKVYRFLGVCYRESDGEPMALYCREKEFQWVRPLSEFMEKFEETQCPTTA